MREVFKELRTGAAQNQPRRRLILPTGSTLHSMAGAWGKYFGTKDLFGASEVRRAFFLPALRCGNRPPLAQFEANYLGQIRTGAASGFATELFWPARKRRRWRSSAAGFRRSPNSKRFAPSGRSRKFASGAGMRRSATGIRKSIGAMTFAKAEGGRARRDIVATATSAKDPVLESAWIGPGARTSTPWARTRLSAANCLRISSRAPT